jgi:amino acid transporter
LTFFSPCSTVAARGILLSQLVTGACAFAATILWLFCTPPLDVWFDLYAPQPFVQVRKKSFSQRTRLADVAQIYALALGKGPSVFMTVLAVVGLILNASIATVAASRLVFAVARDGVLPFSSWVGTVTADGRPKNAVTVMYCFGAILLCTILPSNVAFTSLVSAGGIRESSVSTIFSELISSLLAATIAAYALIAFCRLVFTPTSFKNTRFGLGVFARPFYAIAFLWNGLIFAVRTLLFLTGRPLIPLRLGLCFTV